MRQTPTLVFDIPRLRMSNDAVVQDMSQGQFSDMNGCVSEFSVHMRDQHVFFAQALCAWLLISMCTSKSEKRWLRRHISRRRGRQPCRDDKRKLVVLWHLGVCLILEIERFIVSSFDRMGKPNKVRVSFRKPLFEAPVVFCLHIPHKI